MDIRVRFIGIPTRSRTSHDVKRRVAFALDRLAPAIRYVTVALRDENGPRGGAGKMCTMHVALRSGGRPVVVSARGHSFGEAVAVALDRARVRLERRDARSRRSAA